MPEWWVVVLAIGATARITRFLVRDQLAAPARSAVAARFGDRSMVAYLSRCDWCVSIWVALLVTLAASLFGDTPWFWVPALWLSVAYAAAVASTWAD